MKSPFHTHYLLLSFYLKLYLFIFVFSCQMCMYVCTGAPLKKAQLIPCVFAHTWRIKLILILILIWLWDHVCHFLICFFKLKLSSGDSRLFLKVFFNHWCKLLVLDQDSFSIWEFICCSCMNCEQYFCIVCGFCWLFVFIILFKIYSSITEDCAFC